jgi:hypothetical protein
VAIAIEKTPRVPLVRVQERLKILVSSVRFTPCPPDLGGPRGHAIEPGERRGTQPLATGDHQPAGVTQLIHT